MHPAKLNTRLTARVFASVARRASASAVFAVAAFASVGIATSRKVAACPVASGQAASGQAASGKDGQEKGFEQAKDPKLDWQWERLPSIPNTVGVASPFAGVSHGVLLVAGGANFPDKKPWEGGTKVWHDAVFALDSATSKWRTIGRLARPLAYGVSATWKDRVLCVGGSDAQRHYADCFSLTIRDSELTIEPLPSLPTPIANACGAIVDGVFILAGGLEQPDAPQCSAMVWGLDMNSEKPTWKRFADLPASPRMLATAVAHRNRFMILGGVELVKGADGKPVRKYLRDCWEYELAEHEGLAEREGLSASEGKGVWTRIDDLLETLAASPSPAMSTSEGVWVLGGDNGSQVGRSPESHRGFSKSMHKLDSVHGGWRLVEDTIPAPRVTVPLVEWEGGWVIPSGEEKPGIRSAEVWRIRSR